MWCLNLKNVHSSSGFLKHSSFPAIRWCLNDVLCLLQEWEKLNYDIHTLRYARREVRSRWKKILLQLGETPAHRSQRSLTSSCDPPPTPSAGYQYEVDALLCVSTQSQFSHEGEHLSKAVKLLEQLLDHTSLFPAEAGHQSRYLCVMVHTHTHTQFSFIKSAFGTPTDLCSSSHCSIAQERLVSLDSAEDFVRLAKEKYPKTG